MSNQPIKETCNSSTNPYLFSQLSTPLSSRINAEKPHLTDGLNRLRSLIGDEKFIAYIEPLHNINKSGQTLLITAGSELKRTHLERECITALKEAFDTKLIRIVAIR